MSAEAFVKAAYDYNKAIRDARERLGKEIYAPLGSSHYYSAAFEKICYTAWKEYHKAKAAAYNEGEQNQ